MLEVRNSSSASGIKQCFGSVGTYSPEPVKITISGLAGTQPPHSGKMTMAFGDDRPFDGTVSWTAKTMVAWFGSERIDFVAR